MKEETFQSSLLFANLKKKKIRSYTNEPKLERVLLKGVTIKLSTCFVLLSFNPGLWYTR